MIHSGGGSFFPVIYCIFFTKSPTFRNDRVKADSKVHCVMTWKYSRGKQNQNGDAHCYFGNKNAFLALSRGEGGGPDAFSVVVDNMKATRNSGRNVENLSVRARGKRISFI